MLIVVMFNKNVQPIISYYGFPDAHHKVYFYRLFINGGPSCFAGQKKVIN